MGNRNYLAGKHRIKSSGAAPANPWHCAGCNKMHPGNREQNGTADRIVCERVYFKEFASRRGFAAS